MGCTNCEDQLEHCHGVLVRHPDGRLECVEDTACPGREPAHPWVVGCAEVGCACPGQEGPVRLAA